MRPSSRLRKEEDHEGSLSHISIEQCDIIEREVVADPSFLAIARRLARDTRTVRHETLCDRRFRRAVRIEEEGMGRIALL